MTSTKRRLALVVTVFLIVALAPVAVMAVGGTFTDDDTSVFEADIEWLAGAGVTLGCNPPTNDNFCPDDNVKRGQMAAFMRRFAQFLGAEDGVVSQADNATTADSADKVDGLEAADLMTMGYVVRETGGLAFTGPDQTVATLSLPAGSFVINAALVANNNSGAKNTVNCELLLDGTAIDRTSSDATGIELGPNVTAASRESIALTGAGTLAAAADVTVVCDATTAIGNWLERTITAIQVAAVTESAASEAPASSVDANQ